MKPVAGEAKMNRAEAHEPKGGHAASAGPKSGSDVGQQKKAAMHSAQMGQPTDGLGGAVSELRSQHPEGHSDHGPHHGGTGHVRHKPYSLR